MKYTKCFDIITKVSDFVKIRHDDSERTLHGPDSYKEDCDYFTPCRETEKAWCFDLGKKHSWISSTRFVYAPKSVCKIIENDFHIESDGTFQKDTFVLVPSWIMRKW